MNIFFISKSIGIASEEPDAGVTDCAPKSNTYSKCSLFIFSAPTSTFLRLDKSKSNPLSFIISNIVGISIAVVIGTL